MISVHPIRLASEIPRPLTRPEACTAVRRYACEVVSSSLKPANTTSEELEPPNAGQDSRVGLGRKACRNGRVYPPGHPRGPRCPLRVVRPPRCGRLQQAAHTMCSALCFADQMAGTRRILFKAAFTAMVGPLELQLFSVTGRHTLTPSAAASICDATIIGDWLISLFTVLFTPRLQPHVQPKRLRIFSN